MSVLYFVICIFSFVFHVYSFGSSHSPQTVIGINRIVKIINEKASCSSKDWGHSKLNACYCCINKNSLTKDGIVDVSSDVLTKCIKSKDCNSELIKKNTDYYDPKTEKESKELFAQDALNYSRLITYLGEFPKECFMKETDELSPKGVNHIITLLTEMGALYDGTKEELSKCVQIRPFNKESAKKNNAKQMFEVLYQENCIKSDKSNEGHKSNNFLIILENGLEQIKKEKQAYYRSLPESKNGKFYISLNYSSYFMFKDHHGQPHYLSLVTESKP